MTRGEDANNDTEDGPKNKWDYWRTNAATRRVVELMLYVFFVVVDAHDVWPISHLAALAAGVVLTGSLLFIELPRKAFIASMLVVIVSAAAIDMKAKDDVPLRLTDSAPFWFRIFPHDRDNEPAADGYAVHRDALRAGNPQYAIDVDLLLYITITNTSDAPRRITEYTLESAPEANGPWTPLCPINLSNSVLYWMMSPSEGAALATSENFDQKLSVKALPIGDSMAGLTAWSCPLSSPNECRPGVLRYTLYDSLGKKTQVVISHLTKRPAPPSHDWLSDGYFRAVSRVDLSAQTVVRGICPLGRRPE